MVGTFGICNFLLLFATVVDLGSHGCGTQVYCSMA